MEDEGELRWFLGVKMGRKPGEMSFDQEQYTKDSLKKQGLSSCNLLKIPVIVNGKFVNAIDNDELADANSYGNLMGSLLFIAKQTRPDIFYGVNLLSGFMDKPAKSHMHGAKRFLRYLHGTLKLKIVCRKQENPVLSGESDADWSGDQND